LKDIVFLFAHGAGADKDSNWMLEMDSLLSARKIEVIRFNFPYMDKRKEDGKKRPPDRQPKLLEAFRSQIDSISSDKILIIGGKSMGGRMASILATEEGYSERIDGVICMGFPFHPPGKPEKFRGEHLESIRTKTLIMQGERDTFGTRDEVAEWKFSKNVSVEFLADGDHSFKPRKKSGLTLEDNLKASAEKVEKFARKLS